VVLVLSVVAGAVVAGAVVIVSVVTGAVVVVVELSAVVALLLELLHATNAPAIANITKNFFIVLFGFIN
jgi:hypothetical protein